MNRGLNKINWVSNKFLKLREFNELNVQDE